MGGGARGPPYPYPNPNDPLRLLGPTGGGARGQGGAVPDGDQSPVRRRRAGEMPKRLFGLVTCWHLEELCFQEKTIIAVYLRACFREKRVIAGRLLEGEGGRDEAPYLSKRSIAFLFEGRVVLRVRYHADVGLVIGARGLESLV
jgi:hypothetical protein